MEQKLQELRKRKRREDIWNVLMLKGIMEKIRSPTPPVSINIPTSSPELSETDISISEDNLSVASSNVSSEWNFDPSSISRLTLATYGLYALLWITVLFIMIELRFAVVYCILSGLVGIYLNTRTGPKKQGELSAYSVFNPNCESLDGTLKPEQFEKAFNLIHYSPN